MVILYLIVAMSHAKTIDTRIPIAIVDTGVNLNKSNKNFMCKGLSINVTGKTSPFIDTNGHGSNIVGIITRGLNMQKYCIEMIKYENQIDTYQTAHAITYAVSSHAKFINLSLSGMDSSNVEESAFRVAVSENIRISVAAGNDNLNLDILCNIYPACYPINDPNYHIVGSYTGHFSNQGAVVTYYEDGVRRGSPPLSGTSQATAVHTNKWILGLPLQ